VVHETEAYSWIAKCKIWSLIYQAVQNLLVILIYRNNISYKNYESVYEGS
jgi:hypothetical protein